MSDDDLRLDALLRAVAAVPPIQFPVTPHVLGDRFGLLRRLGEGTFGVVYEADDHLLHRHVALKLLRQPRPEWIHRFKREFRALRDLAHINLVALEELFCFGDQWFFTMELLEGRDVLQYIRGASSSEDTASGTGSTVVEKLHDARPTVVDHERIRRVLRQLAEGLSAFHASGRVHRDIKPSNVYVTRNERLVVLDVGLATDIGAEEGSMASAVVGTPAYMAPEQAAGERVTSAADMYAVGVLLHEMLYGCRPARQAHNTGFADAPADLAGLCRELIAVDATKRPTAEAMQSRLIAKASQLEEKVTPRLGRPFVGRDLEMAALSDAFGAARRGGGASVFVLHGESGIGKSRAVREFAAALKRSHPALVVLAGQCHEREAVPYKAIDGVIDALVSYLRSIAEPEVGSLLPTRAGILAQVFPAFLRVPSIERHETRHGSSTLPDLRARAFRELRDLLTRLSFSRPVLIIIDDLQWADADGLMALTEMVRPPDAPPLLVVGTLRTGAAVQSQDAIASLTSMLTVPLRAMPLGGLGHEECLALASRLARGQDVAETDLERIASESGGHPLFVEQLVDDLHTGGSEELTLDHAIVSRVSRVAPPGRQLVEVIALVGQPIATELAAIAAGIGGEELGRTLTMLTRERLTRRAGDALVDVYHGRVRDAIRAHLGPTRQQELHARIAEAYESAHPRDCEALGLHWHEAGKPSRALPYVVQAGDSAAAKLAFERAATWYELALEFVADDPVRRHDLQCRLGDALAHAGRGARAAAHFFAAAEVAAPEQAATLHRRAADQLLRSGHLAEGLAATASMLEQAGVRLPSSRARLILSTLGLRFWLALRGLRFRPVSLKDERTAAATRLDTCLVAAYALSFVEPLQGLWLQTRGLLWALALGEPGRISRALGLELGYLGSYGQRVRRRFARLVAQAHKIAGDAPEPSAMVSGGEGAAQFLNGAFVVGLESTTRSIEILERHLPGLVHERVTMEMFRLNLLAELGRFRDLGRLHRAALADASSRGDLYAQIVFSTGMACMGWLVDDHPDEAERASAIAMQAWPAHPITVEHLYALSGRFLVAMYSRDAAAAAMHADNYGRTVRHSLFHRIQKVRIAMHYYRGAAAVLALAHGAGEVRQPLRTVRTAARSILAERAEWARGFACQLRGAALLHGGRRDDAIAELERAVASLERHQMAGYAIGTQVVVGGLRGGASLDNAHERAQAFCADQGVAAPDRFLGMLAAGLRLN